METLNTYKIEHRISTLSRCAVMDTKDKLASFVIEDIEFSHWDFNYRDGCLGDAWKAELTIKAKNSHEAFSYFRKKLTKIIPRVALISQGYVDFISEPFLISKDGCDTAFFRYVKDVGSVGLMFMEKEKEALNLLLGNNTIPEEFYYYWNDSVNTIGYSPKLLLMFSAIEALVKKDGKKDWELLNTILGEELLKDLFGTKENSNTGLRHRLVHGEYFNESDHGKNYLELVHKKVIAYFNSFVFSKELIHENVVHPQRHFFGNKEECKTFLKNKDNSTSFSFKDILEDFNENGFRNPDKYDFVYDDNLNTNY